MISGRRRAQTLRLPSFLLFIKMTETTEVGESFIGCTRARPLNVSKIIVIGCRRAIYPGSSFSLNVTCSLLCGRTAKGYICGECERELSLLVSGLGVSLQENFANLCAICVF